MKMKDLKGLSTDELIQKEKGFKKDLFGLTFQKKFGNVEKPGRFQMLKKDIARIQTLLNERQKNESTTK